MKQFCKRTHKKVLQVSGPDAEKFLQGQLTCNVKKLASGDHTLGAFCSAQGRMHGNFRILRRNEDTFLLQLESSILDSFVSSLKKYIVFSKAQISTPEIICYAIYNDEDTTSTELENVIAISSNYFELWIEEGNSSELLLENEYTTCEEGFFQKIDICLGLAWVTKELVGEYIPQMFNLDLTGSISFDKGCYTGQEIVARTHYRGQVKRRMYLGSFPANDITVDQINNNAELINVENKVVGNLINSVTMADNVFCLYVLNKPEYLDENVYVLADKVIQPLDLPYSVAE